MANDFSAEPYCVALWSFESGALTTDSKGSNTLTDNNTVGTSTGDYKEGAACADFEDSSSECFTITDANLDSDFPLKNGDSNKKISVCGWFKAESLSATNDGLFSKFNPTDDKRTLRIEIYNSAFSVEIGYNSGASAESLYNGGSLSPGIWYHFGFTYQDSDKSWKLVVWDDNAGSKIIDSSGNATNNINVEDSLIAIGASYNTSGTPGGFFDGLIDELVVFKDILTADEIDEIRQGIYSYTPLEASLTEGVGLGDTMSPQLLANAEITEGIGLMGDSDAAPFYAQSSNGVGVGDSLEINWNLQAELEEGVGAGADIDGIREVYAEQSEEAGLGDSMVGNLLASDSLTESPFIYDDADFGWISAVTSSAEIADSVEIDVSIPVHDWMEVKETILNNWVGDEAVASTFAAIDSIKPCWLKSITSTAGIADTLAIDVGILLKEFLEAIDGVENNWAGSESVETNGTIRETIIPGWLKSLVSTMGISDALGIDVAVPVLDALTVEDVAENNWAGSESVTSTLNFLGLAIIAQVFNEAVTSTADAVDVVSFIHQMVAAVESALGTADSVSNTVAFNPIISESLAVAGTIAVLHTLYPTISETAQAVDEAGFGWDEAIADGGAIADTLAIQWIAMHILTESLQVTDAAAALFEFTDTVISTLQAAAAVTIQQALQDSVEDILNFGITIRLDDEVWECWVLNTNAFHASVYSGYDYNSYAIRNNQAFAAREGGIYRLDGDDDNGATINSGIILPSTSFGTSRQKRFRKAFFGLSGSSPSIRMETDNGSQTYTISSSKANLSRAQKGKEWVIKLQGFDDLDFIELVPIILTR